MEKQYKLEKEFGTKWLAALRSGKFKQGSQYLKSEDGYCCLGVACAITMPSANLKDAHFIISKKDVDANTCSERELISTKLYDSIPELLRGDCNLFARQVSEMNDEGVPFEEIADWIEQNVELV